MATARRFIWVGVGVGLMLLAWGFARQHATTVTLHYGFGEWPEVPLWLALLGSFGVGALCVALFAGYEIARISLASRRYRKAVRGLEEEVHQLRNLPLGDEAWRSSQEPDAAEDRLAVGGGFGGAS